MKGAVVDFVFVSVRNVVVRREENKEKVSFSFRWSFARGKLSGRTHKEFYNSSRSGESTPAFVVKKKE